MEFNLKDLIPGFLKGAPEAPRELDKTKAKLNELRETITSETIGEVWGKLRPSFDADMEELGITDAAKKEELWQQVRHEVESNQLENSEELRNVNAFINNSQNLPELKKIIESTDPKAKADQWLKSLSEKIPGWGLISGWIAATLIDSADKSKKENGDRESVTGGMLRKLASWLGGGENRETPEYKETAARAKALMEKFKAQGIVMDAASWGLGLMDLEKEDTPDAIAKLANEALKPEGSFIKIYEALKTVNKDNLITPKLQITDLRFQKNFKADQINLLVAAIKGEKGSKYQMKKDGLAGARELLDAALLVRNKTMEEALKDFERKPDAAPAVAQAAPQPPASPSTAPNQG